MILIKTTAPQLVDATALYSPTFVQKNTNLCAFTNALSADYKLSFDNKNFEQSATPINALRTYMQDIILLGNQLDVQTLQMHVDRVLSLPPQMVGPLIREIDEAFVTAGQRRSSSGSLSGSTGNQGGLSNNTGNQSGSLGDVGNQGGSSNNAFGAGNQGGSSNGDSFPSKLANLLNQCDSPCNYFKPIGDVVALLANAMQQNTGNVAPAWDGASSLLHAPLNIAGATLNKISVVAQQLLASVATATKNIVAKATEPLFNSNRVQTETSLLQQGKSMSFTSHGGYLATDPFPYFQTQNNASNLLARAKSSLSDCFRLHEFKYRYNPLDANMNMSVAINATINVTSEGSNYKLNVFGKLKTPPVKPFYLSIKDFLDYTESRYDWDDDQNWNRYPKTGKKETEAQAQSQTQAQAQAQAQPQNNDANNGQNQTANGKANVNGSKVTDYGQADDPYKDSNTMKGIGAGGIGEPGKGRAGLKGGNYLLKDYSMAASPDVEAQMRASGVKLGDWVNVQTADGRTFPKRFDDRTANNLTGRVDFYSPVGRAPGLDSPVTTITKASGPPADYVQPPRYVNGVAVN